MWVSQKEFRALRNEVDALKREHDARVKDAAESLNFTVYHPTETEFAFLPSGHGYERRCSQKISIRDVLTRVLDRLSMKLVYVEGRPARVDVQVEPKGKANVR